MLSRKHSHVRVDRKLVMSKGAKLVTTNSAGTETELDMTELAALNDVSATDLAKIDGITNGTVAAGKAAVVDSNKDIGDFRNLDAVNIDAGASGTAGSVDVFPATASKGKLAITKADNTSDDTTTLTFDEHGQATTIHVPDGGAADSYVAQSTAALTLAEVDVLDGATAGTQVASKAVIADANINTGISKITELHIGASGSETQVTATATELNYNDIATLGTLAASKTWTSDASLDTVMPTGGLLTVQSGGAVTFNSGSTLTIDGTTETTVEAAEHGAGAIGTAVAPRTYRWTDRGVIITQTKIDLTGLASVATADDVIGLAAGGAAYIGRNVEATNGVIFKVELACLETPTGGDNDVNVVANASASLAYDDAGGTTYLSNSGDLLKGQTIQNLLPALTEGDYFYLTAGTGDTAGTYTAGMYVLTTYGHATL